jgi:predicted GH43/DUF377 family glycosyl hydrolase
MSRPPSMNRGNSEGKDDATVEKEEGSVERIQTISSQIIKIYDARIFVNGRRFGVVYVASRARRPCTCWSLALEAD